MVIVCQKLNEEKRIAFRKLPKRTQGQGHWVARSLAGHSSQHRRRVGIFPGVRNPWRHKWMHLSFWRHTAPTALQRWARCTFHRKLFGNTNQPPRWTLKWALWRHRIRCRPLKRSTRMSDFSMNHEWGTCGPREHLVRPASEFCLPQVRTQHRVKTMLHKQILHTSTISQGVSLSLFTVFFSLFSLVR